MKRGLLLFAHGARDSRWALPFEDIVDRVRLRAPQVPVVLGFLEFMTPGFAEAGHSLAAAGCDRVDVVPLFLGAGGHVRKDIPELLLELEAAHPQVHWELRPAIGEVDSVVEAMAMASLAWIEGS
ncbi:MAG TPA: CbiX/SirB N-terminal domain-containing protein [Albitalea sp.]|jgi:sirohydrochlorin cobaltochelatase|nr:CbiX/SirB N-terminal domain-containing protein [Albitalea sp.]